MSLIPLTQRTYYMPAEKETDRPVFGLVCGDRCSLVVDGGTSPRHALEFRAEAAQISVAPLRYGAITHWHWDHVFGIKALNLITIAHRETEAILTEWRGFSWDDTALEKHVAEGRLPAFSRDCLKQEMTSVHDRQIGAVDIQFTQELTIDLGGVTCVIEHVGGSHTDDSVIIYVPEEKVLFLGDCIYGRRHHGMYGYSRATLYPMLQAIRKYPADHYLISHEEPYTSAKMDSLMDNLETCGDLVGDRISAGQAVEDFKRLHGKDPDEEATFYMECFANVNRVEKEKGACRQTPKR